MVVPPASGRVGKKLASLAILVLAVAGLSALAPSTDAHAGQPTTSVVAQPGGGYITTYTAANGDVTKISAATPVTVTADPDTTTSILVNGQKRTLHHGGVGFAPTRAPIDKSAIMHSALARAADGTNITPYEELIAMGVSASDAAPFKNIGGTAGSGQTRTSPNGA